LPAVIRSHNEGMRALSHAEIEAVLDWLEVQIMLTS
jgi:hypothetical protein